MTNLKRYDFKHYIKNKKYLIIGCGTVLLELALGATNVQAASNNDLQIDKQPVARVTTQSEQKDKPASIMEDSKNKIDQTTPAMIGNADTKAIDTKSVTADYKNLEDKTQPVGIAQHKVTETTDNNPAKAVTAINVVKKAKDKDNGSSASADNKVATEK